MTNKQRLARQGALRKSALNYFWVNLAKLSRAEKVAMIEIEESGEQDLRAVKDCRAKIEKEGMLQVGL